MATAGAQSVRRERLGTDCVMWCHACQQDVPGVASSEGDYRCARCNTSWPSAAVAAPAQLSRVDDSGLDLSARGRKSPPVQVLDWEAEESERQIKHRLQSALKDTPAEAAPSRLRRFDPPQLSLTSYSPAAGEPLPPPRPLAVERPTPRASALAWFITALGLMGFACGGVLLGWSLWTDRGDLWTLGLPITLGGQCGLVIGLLLQLERVWKTSSDTSTKLDNVDQRLEDLQHLTTVLGTSQTSASGAFYAHLSDGAGPQVLLADLKSQLDLLATHMARR